MVTLLVQGHNAFAVGQCLGGYSTEALRDRCRIAVEALLGGNSDERILAVRCLVESVEDSWSFERILRVISEEESVSGEASPVFAATNNPILKEAFRPFGRMSTFNFKRLPISLLDNVEHLSKKEHGGQQQQCWSIWFFGPDV